ncbi:MAG: hypothetical protein IK065_06120 [Neisseriaceae bacterium]|nr:hypothetical protein [Neisseriaceae bacterium]
MSLRQDVVDIYTKSSVYYFRLQYLIICYLIVLAGSFFVLPLPREMGIDGVARLLIGGALYIGFVVLMVYAPKLFYPLIGKALSPYKDEKEVEEKFNRLSEKDKQEVEQAIEAEYGVNYKKNGVLVITMNKMQRVATNVFFQCLLIELFCLVVLINQDHSLMISNPVTQGVADVLQNYTDSSSNGYGYKDAFFTVSNLESLTGDKHTTGGISFSKYSYMSESIFFIHIIFMTSNIVRLFSTLIFTRQILISDFFSVVKNSIKSIKNMFFAFIGTIIFLTMLVASPLFFGELCFSIAEIVYFPNWIQYSIIGSSMGIFLILISFRFMEDWYKLIFRKF